MLLLWNWLLVTLSNLLVFFLRQFSSFSWPIKLSEKSNTKAIIYSNSMDKFRAGTYAKIDVSITLSGVYQRLKLKQKKTTLIFARFTVFIKHSHLNLIANIYTKVSFVIIIIILIISEPGFLSFVISSWNEFFIRWRLFSCYRNSVRWW